MKTSIKSIASIKSLIFMCIGVFFGLYIGININTPESDLLDTQRSCIEQADIIMDKYNLFDRDGSDDMALYLELAKKSDKAYYNE